MNLDSILAQASSAHTQGALEDAEVLYRHLLECSPDHPDALYLLGVLYLQTSRYQAAIPLFERFLALHPFHADVLMHLALAYREAGDVQRAENGYLQVLQLDAGNSQAHFNLAELYQTAGRLDDALLHYQETLRLAHRSPDAWFNLGVLHYARKEFPAAESAYRQFIELQPNSAEAHYNLGAVLHDQNKLEEAKAEYRQALALNPGLSDAHRGMGNIHLHERDYVAAAGHYRQAMALKPEDAELANNLGVVLQKLNRLDEALVCFRQALEWAPDHINAHFNLALVLLLKGEFAEGWREYEWRRRIKGRTLDVLDQPEWEGAPLAGKTILVRAEQGFGDTFQFMRYLPLLASHGAKVVFECQAGLQRVLRGVEGISQVVQKTATGNVLAQFDTYIPLLSLPRVLQTELGNIPAQVPYLTAEAWLAERWQARLAADTNFKIGFVWAGRPTHEDDRNRSMVLADFLKLADVPGVSWYSLQKGAAAEALADLVSHWHVTSLDAELDDFADTAAAIMNLDLVISVDTSVAHLAGALGKPIWVLLPYAPDWRWLVGRADSPWYPSMRLFRQRQSGDWQTVFAEVRSVLPAEISAIQAAKTATAHPGYSSEVAHGLELAWARYRLGKNSEALAACKAILARQPGHPEANYLAGLAYLGQDEHALALSCFEQVVASWPHNPGVQKNLGIACQALGRLEAAAEGYQRALALGNEEADLLYNLGTVRLAQGEAQEAVGYFERALEYQPAFAEALNNLGLALQRLDRGEAAIEYFKQALQAKTDFFDAQLNLGNALYAAGKFDEAETIYRGALRLQPFNAALHNSLGVTLKAQARLAEATLEFRQALAADPQLSEAYNNLGNSLKALDDLSGAVESYRHALSIAPGNASAWNNLGNALQAQGAAGEASACFERALEIVPGFAEAHWNRAIALLLNGDYKQGWREYEWGFAAGQRPVRDFSQPRWQGESFPGKTLLVYAEQGFGDTIQFARFLAAAKEKGGRVVLECQPELVNLLQRCKGVDEVIPYTTETHAGSSFDFQVPLMSLPVILGTTLATLPGAMPYLQPDPERVAYWREHLGGDGLKAGFVWAGRPTHQDDRKRSCAFAAFLPLFDLPGIRFYSLQKGMAATELVNRASVANLGTALRDFADTAAVIANLDLVIAVDTSVAHLAGALGKPVWVLLPHAPDWRWLQGRDDSPWYPSARLFRQETPGDWNKVILAARNRLRELLKEARNNI